MPSKTKKIKVGRPGRAKATSASLEEIKKFYSHYPDLNAVSRALNVSRATLYAWSQGQWRPSVEKALLMQKLSGGKVNADIILRPPGLVKCTSAEEHILKNFILPRVKNMGITLEFYIHAHTTVALRDILARDEILYEDIKTLVDALGGNVEYWCNIKEEIDYAKKSVDKKSLS